jgi:hypothetical protein
MTILVAFENFKMATIFKMAAIIPKNMSSWVCLIRSWIESFNQSKRNFLRVWRMTQRGTIHFLNFQDGCHFQDGRHSKFQPMSKLQKAWLVLG